jgi:hypothetical protein
VAVDDITNREGLGDFDVRWPWGRGHLASGITAVLRARDEAHNLPWVLPPLLRTVHRVVLVDNLSQDDTADVAREVARGLGLEDRLEVTEYPFPVARCGSEHLATPADSVHNLAYFYNWSFALARTSYSMKWDGDMVLTAEGSAMITDLFWQIETEPTIVVFQHHPLYVANPSLAWLDVKLKPKEPWIYPVGPEFTFLKGFDWEIRNQPEDITKITMPEGLCFELKWLDRDEFTHWTDPAEFDERRSPRKVREYAVFRALAEGREDELDSVIRIEAPPGVHVVDHVRDTWLPAAKRPLGAAPATAG